MSGAVVGGQPPPVLVAVAPPEPAASAPAERPARRWRAGAAVPYLYLLPALVGLAVWVYQPLVQTLRLSFFKWDLLPTSPRVWAGLDEYRELLALPTLWRALGNTGLYVVALLLFAVVVPVLVALAVRTVGPRAGTLYRALVFVPFLVAPVAAAVLWQWLLAPGGGLVNSGLGAFGVAEVNWLREPLPAFVSVVVIAGWQLIGFASLVMIAGLASIQPEYAQAAALDGATRWQVTWHITLPLLRPTIAMMTLITVLISGQWLFPIVDTLTQGGPGTATTNLYYVLYQYGFRSFDVGLASAAGVLFFVLFAAIALVGVWLMDRLSFHEE